MKSMRSNYTALLTPTFRVLSDAQMEEIHLATLEILERVGVSVPNAEALELLAGAGAEVVGGDRVRIPAFLVEKAVRSAPKRVVLCNRSGERVMFLEDNRAYFGPNADCPDYLDPFTRERRPYVSEDVKAMARVCDYLPHMDFILEAGLSSDVEDEMLADRVVFQNLVTNTEKIIVFCCGPAEGFRDIVEMAAIVAGGYDDLRRSPFIVHYSEPISPLQHYPDGLEKLLLCAELGIPLVYIPMPQAGATAPATMAGTLAQCNAETLSGLVIQQLKSEGAPYIYGGIPSMMDMRWTTYSYGAPELNLMCAALTDMAHYYRLPMFGTAGCTDARDVDLQAAVESALSCLMSALSGANLVHDTALMNQATLISPELMVLTDEILGMVRRIMGGVEVNEETLALEVIAQAGPGGNYLGREHTLRHFREMWYPDVFERCRYEDWLAGERLSIRERVNRKTRDILEKHQPQPLPDDVLKELASFEKKWRRR